MAMPRAFAFVVIPDPCERVFVGATLTMTGLRVRVTGSFRRARAVMLTYPPSVLVTDIGPGFTKGLELARLGRSLRPHMTQLVTSNCTELRREVEATGAVFLLNPMTESQLLAALYRTTLREPNADGSVGRTLPQVFAPASHEADHDWYQHND
jgi:DNA-binding NtrC family response regulator